MDLTEIYQKGEAYFKEKDFGRLLDYVETGFIKDRSKMLTELDQILAAEVTWVGVEIDAGQGTKILDQEMGFECRPFTSKEIADIKKRVPMPLACKGVLSKEDAQRCLDAGADILVVSSHGGHTLDYLPHPLQVMEEIAVIVAGKAVIIVDGGFRRGSDVLKGLAFGASLVGLGRPILYGMAAGGEAGVRDLVDGISRELSRLMTMTGVSDPQDVSLDILNKIGSSPM